MTGSQLAAIGLGAAILCVAAVGMMLVNHENRLQSLEQRRHLGMPLANSATETNSRREFLREVAVLQLTDCVFAVEHYHFEIGRLPLTLEELTQDVTRDGYAFLDRTPLDPWGRPLVYMLAPAGEYTILSVGPDGEEGTADDVPWLGND